MERHSAAAAGGVAALCLSAAACVYTCARHAPEPEPKPAPEPLRETEPRQGQVQGRPRPQPEPEPQPQPEPQPRPRPQPEPEPEPEQQGEWPPPGWPPLMPPPGSAVVPLPCRGASADVESAAQTFNELGLCIAASLLPPGFAAECRAVRSSPSPAPRHTCPSDTDPLLALGWGGAFRLRWASSTS